MELLDYINTHKDWEVTLKKPPFSIMIKAKDRLRILKYNQFESDFSFAMVKQCRGIIVGQRDDGTWCPVCYPFNRFFNYDEPYSDAKIIDWKSARVQTKVDGSIMKLYYYDNSWRIATNSMINADEVTAVSPKMEEDEEITFGELFRTAAKRQHFDFESDGKLDKNKTYIFELTSKYNEQVVHYDGIQIWHLGTRDNISLQEEIVDIGVQKPQEWPLTCIDDCINLASRFKGEQEGFVVVDKNWNRIKIKSPYYLLKSHDLNEHISMKKIVAVYLSGDYDEFLSYFPNHAETIQKLEDIFNNEADRLEKKWQQISSNPQVNSMSQKEFYFFVKDLDYHYQYFIKRFRGIAETKDGKPYTAKEYLRQWVKLRSYLLSQLLK